VHAYGADLNLYAYVRGAVLKNVDPLGLQDQNSGTDTQGNAPEPKDRPSSTPEPPQRKMEAGPETGSRGTNSGQPTPAPAPIPERAKLNLPPNIGGRGAPADESQNHTKVTELNTIEIAAIVITIAPPGTFARAGAAIAGAARGVAQAKKARDMAAMEKAIAESQALAQTPAATEGVLASKAVRVPSSRYPESAAHIRDAQAAGHPAELTIGQRGSNAGRRTEALAGRDKVPHKDLDEYPPAMFEEGGKGASVRPITPRDNRGAGACIGNQCRGLAPGSKVRIIVE
jgi:hypothetical protein